MPREERLFTGRSGSPPNGDGGMEDMLLFRVTGQDPIVTGHPGDPVIGNIPAGDMYGYRADGYKKDGRVFVK